MCGSVDKYVTVFVAEHQTLSAHIRQTSDSSLQSILTFNSQCCDFMQKH